MTRPLQQQQRQPQQPPAAYRSWRSQCFAWSVSLGVLAVGAFLPQNGLAMPGAEFKTPSSVPTQLGVENADAPDSTPHTSSRRLTLRAVEKKLQELLEFTQQFFKSQPPEVRNSEHLQQIARELAHLDRLVNDLKVYRACDPRTVWRASPSYLKAIQRLEAKIGEFQTQGASRLFWSFVTLSALSAPMALLPEETFLANCRGFLDPECFKHYEMAAGFAKASLPMALAGACYTYRNWERLIHPAPNTEESAKIMGQFLKAQFPGIYLEQSHESLAETLSKRALALQETVTQ